MFRFIEQADIVVLTCYVFLRLIFQKCVKNCAGRDFSRQVVFFWAVFGSQDSQLFYLRTDYGCVSLICFGAVVTSTHPHSYLTF